MAALMVKLMLPLFFLFIIPPKAAYAVFEQWCVADAQAPEKELRATMNWVCRKGGADCRKIQVKQPCYLPNTLKDHASYVFNSYYQKFKHRGASCNFRGAAMTTEMDPSHGSCHYDFIR
ncbi:glucan endo-1,3-beta-glucosidase 4-like [Vigna unguiculata]|uniref:glucan endo-1,3-beta-glucosidase 4-like n=1 Tax=Vigna unguiculata TaxID=3917 RepID=UPI001016DA70|nr:glucan endo-1,3-beta-glucosidase 4-like [Vigna unguiculata]